MKVKKLLAVILSVMMLVSVCPFAFAADGNVAKVGDVEYSTVQEAVSVADDGATVTLIADATTDSAIVIDKAVTIALGSFSVTGTAKSVFQVTATGNLTVTGTGNVQGASGKDANCVMVYEGGVANLKGGNYNVGPDANGLGNACIYAYGGIINISGGTYKTEAAYKDRYYVLNTNNVNGMGGQIIVSGGTFYNCDPAAGDDVNPGTFLKEGYKSTDNGEGVYKVTKISYAAQIGDVKYETLQEAVTAAVDGDEITLLKSVTAESAIVIDKTVTINLKSYVITGKAKSVFYVSGTGNLTVTSTLVSTASSVKKVQVQGASGIDANCVMVAEGGVANLQGGRYKVGPDANGLGNACIYAYGGTINISGGYYETEASYKDRYYVLNTNNVNGKGGQIIVSGGVFVNCDPSAGDDVNPGTFVAEGFASGIAYTNSTAKRYSVVAESGIVASVAGVAYSDYGTAQSAAASTGEPMIIQNDFRLTSAKTIGKGQDITIDLNGKTITAAQTAFNVYGKLTVNDSVGTGKIIASDNPGSGQYQVFKVSGSQAGSANNLLTINGGTFIVKAAKDGSGQSVILSYDGGKGAGYGGNVVINGGYFESEAAYNGKYYVLNKQDGTDGTITVNGGTYKNFDPANPGTEPGETASFVADGYKAVDNGDGTYTVEESKLEIEGSNLLVEENIKPNVFVSEAKAAEFDTVEVEFELGGKVYTGVENAAVAVEGYKAYTIEDLAAKQMADVFKATAYGIVNGEKVEISESVDYSIAQYVKNALASNNDSALTVMLIDMLSYGTAAQKFYGYNTSTLATDVLTAEQLAMATTAAPAYQNDLSNDASTLTGDTKIAGASLELVENANIIMYVLGDVTGLTLQVKNSAGIVVAETSNFVFDENVQAYIAVFDGVSADQMREVYSFALVNGDTVVSNTVTYSIATYCTTATGDISDVATELLQFGDSAAAYYA